MEVAWLDGDMVGVRDSKNPVHDRQRVDPEVGAGSWSSSPH
ncbi:hypothetical protein [Nocardia gipuzkoensis]